MKVEQTPHSWYGIHSISKVQLYFEIRKEGGKKKKSITNAAYWKESPSPKKYFFITSSYNSPWHAVKTPCSGPPITEFRLTPNASHWTASRPFSFFLWEKEQRGSRATSRLGKAHFICFHPGRSKGCMNTANPLLPPTLALKDTGAGCSRVWTKCADLLMKLKERGHRQNSERCEGTGRKWKGIKRR